MLELKELKVNLVRMVHQDLPVQKDNEVLEDHQDLMAKLEHQE